MMQKLYDLFEKSEDKRFKDEEESFYKYEDKDRLFFGQKGQNKYKDHHDRFLKKIETHKFGETTKTGENLDSINLHNLTVEEASIIYMYTSHQIYNDVNYQLRNHRNGLDEDIQEYANLLNHSLDKLSSINNTTLYRDVNNPENGIENSMGYYSQNIGAEIICKDFMSTHKSNGRWSDEETGFQIVIETNEKSNAKDLCNISFCVSEEEVLFKSGGKFLVKSVDVKNRTVYLKEI